MLSVLLLTYTQPTPPGSTDVIVLLEGLLEPPEELAVLYPGCSADSNVVLNIADSSLFNVTMVSLKFMITTMAPVLGWPQELHNRQTTH